MRHRVAELVASFVFAAAFLVILAIVHVVERELTIGHLISEYELGRHGWLMSLAFVTLGMSSVTFSLAIRHEVATRAGRIAAGWLRAIALAYVGGAVFLPDSAAGFTTPTSVTPSVAGYLHGACGIIVIVGSPLAFTLLGRSVARDPEWRAVARRVRCVTVVPWLGLLSFGASLVGFAFTQPQTRARMLAVILVTVTNRVLIVSYCVWLMVMALTLYVREADGSLSLTDQ